MLQRRSLLALLTSPIILPGTLQAQVTPAVGGIVPQGLVGDGMADDTAPLRRALATGQPVNLPPGRFRVSRGLELARGQILAGAGARVSSILVRPEFDRSSAAVFSMASGEPGAQLRDFGIAFAQPEGNDRSNLIPYPPAIRAVGAPRFRVDRLLIQRAIVGIDMRGNSGGAAINELEISALDTAIWIDGSLDSVRISRLHAWPFGLTPKQGEIYRDGQAYGILCGRCDDFHLDNSILFGLQRAVVFRRSPAGSPFGTLIGVTFDTQGGLVSEYASLRVQSCTFTTGLERAQWIVGKGGVIDVTGCNFLSSRDLSLPGIELSAGVAFNLATCSFNTAARDFVHLRTGGRVRLVANGLTFNKQSRGSYRNPLIQIQSGGRAALSNLVATDLAPGPGILLQAAPDAQVAVSNVVAPGWQNDLPGGR
ncbi:glycoside hydrolase family 55 protein [Roseomonas sp. OT10]|uniref:glycoside hydrolase family 55 protein n=1 Tax=Roseomonas cutis TaxID=2897332 RepID=UPI001E48FD50|nr:glycoside hydrolase family 55 protein [Roseomonas sp. OT10]UFN49626.1 glycoside hydrolase family 55 protein [Roseomonas sp. OT10]